VWLKELIIGRKVSFPTGSDDTEFGLFPASLADGVSDDGQFLKLIF
jgi:hypothetical protein